jgi:hypothetical protein
VNAGEIVGAGAAYESWEPSVSAGEVAGAAATNGEIDGSADSVGTSVSTVRVGGCSAAAVSSYNAAASASTAALCCSCSSRYRW